MLFVTQYALSNRTAIGVQTELLTRQFARWIHFYWEPERAPTQKSGSYRLENGLPLLWPFTRGRGFFRRSIDTLGLSWWRNNRLLPKHQRQVSVLADDVDACYVAPLDNADATRCRDIVETIGRRFVIHLWDILDGNLSGGSPDLQWLVRNAEHVFCVSHPLAEEALEFNKSVSFLQFQRSPSQWTAAPPLPSSVFRIALIGHLNSYRDGLTLLVDALQAIEAEGIKMEIIYLGQKAGLEFLPAQAKRLITYEGFPDDDERDRILASCHAGFLPGPLQPPQIDGRSRYSIPSRVLDFWAVGLPVIAAVHPQSAAAAFLETVRDEGVFVVEQPGEIAAAVRALRDGRLWRESSKRLIHFFRDEFAVGTIKPRLAAYFERRREN